MQVVTTHAHKWAPGPQDHIIFLTFLVARGGGINTIRKSFPGVRIISGGLDHDIKEGWLAHEDDAEGEQGRKVWVIEPGLGNIGSVLCRGGDDLMLTLGTGNRYF